jgi:hypothetical protein
MPDLATVSMRECASLYGVFVVRSQNKKSTSTYEVAFSRGNPGPYEVNGSCTCPAFTFRKDERDCKHIADVVLHACQWTEHAGRLSPDPVEFLMPDTFSVRVDADTADRCPVCGGPTVSAMVGV